jgi:hypothetical protein
MTSFLGASVTARGKVFGNVYLTDKRGAVEFDEADEEALLTSIRRDLLGRLSSTPRGPGP